MGWSGNLAEWELVFFIARDSAVKQVGSLGRMIISRTPYRVSLLVAGDGILFLFVPQERQKSVRQRQPKLVPVAIEFETSGS